LSGIILKAVFQLHMLNNWSKKQKYVISKANFDFVLDFKTKRKHKIEHFPLKLTKWIRTPGLLLEEIMQIYQPIRSRSAAL
jgi:hypothetical protein